MLSLMVAGGVALWLAGLLTPVLVRRLREAQIGQHIREDGPSHHAVKAGTPTMGGVVIVAAVIVGLSLIHI